MQCCTLVSLAAAQSGYRYQNPPLRPAPIFRPQPAPQSNSGIISVQQSQPLAQFNLNGGQQSYVSQPQPLPAPAPAQLSFAPQLPQQNYLPPQSNIDQSSFGPSSSGQSLQQPSYQNFPQQQQTIITKDIYIHSAPEDLEQETGLNNQYENTPIRKNYRIVFIKAPSQNLNFATAALKRAQPNHEEKTVIYVLSKKPDLSEVQQQLAQVNNEQKSHKPEVYFIKYRTQEEAQRAQQEIQAQYDALGGSTHISDEGIAPIRSVIGSAGSSGLSLGSGSGGSGSFGSASQQQLSFAGQSNFQQSGSGGGFGTAPAQKYLPVKATK